MRNLMLLFLAFWVAGCIASAQSGTFNSGAEPDGFRGIKWGTHISMVKEMIQVWEDEGRKYYERKDEALELGGAKLERVTYLFWKDRFFEVRISILKNYEAGQDELSNFKMLREVCFKKFGKQKKPLFGKEEYSWVGNKTWASLVNEEPGFLRLTLGSPTLLGMKKALEDQKLRQDDEYRQAKVREARGF
jgi:hypothetical protein